MRNSEFLKRQKSAFGRFFIWADTLAVEGNIPKRYKIF